MITLIPVKGKIVIDPETSRAVPAEGVVMKKITQYWKNRKTDGDVTQVSEKIKKESK